MNGKLTKYRVLVVATLILGIIATGTLVNAAEKVTITWWTPYATPFYEPWSSWIPEAFEKAHPEIDLKVVPLSWDDLGAKLLPAIAGGTPPECFQYFSWMGDLVEKGAVRRLDTFVTKDPEVNPEDWYPGVWESTKYKGHIYGLPGETDSSVFYWNKGMFREVGLDPENPPRTWPEVEKYAERLTERDPQGQLRKIGFWVTLDSRFLIPFGHMNGGKFSDAISEKITTTDPGNIKALEWIVSFAEKYGATDLLRFSETKVAAGGDLFAVGNLGMEVQGSYMWSQHDKYGPDVEYGIAQMPIPVGGKHATITSPSIQFIPTGTKHPEQAWTFIKWYALNATLKWCLQVGDLVTRKGQIDTVMETMGEDKWKVEPCYKALDSSIPWPRTPVMAYYNDTLNAAIEEAFLGKKTPEEALMEVEAEVQADLNRVLGR